MVFHIARAIDIFGFEAAALEFVEDRAVGLAHHIGQNRQAAAVGHADDDLFQAQGTAALDDLFHRGDQRLAAIKAEALGAHVFDMEEFLEAFGLDQLVEDRLAPFAGKGDFLAVTLDPLFEPSGLLGVGNMHVLQREGAAIGALHDLEDLAHRGHLQAKHIVDEDRAIHIGIGKAVGFRIKLGVGGGLAHSQRVEIGDQMATDAVGADDHQRADTIENGALDLRIGHFDALGLGFRLDLVACAFDLGCGLRPFAG